MSLAIIKKTITPGSIREVLVVSFPIMISQGSNSLMLFTDRYLLTSLGPAYPSASMAGGFLSWILSIFFVGLLSYSTALVGQYYGSGQRAKCSVVLGQGILISFIVFPLLMVFGELFAPIFLGWAGTHAEETKLALEYFRICNYGTLAVLLVEAFSSFLSGLGKTRPIMIINVVGMLLNIPISYFWIHQSFAPGLGGIAGAAFGTVISSVLMATFFAVYLWQIREEAGLKGAKIFRFDKAVFSKLLYFGAPTGGELFLIVFAYTSFVTIFHSYGINEALAMTTVLNWEIVAFLPLWGLNVGLMSLVGQHMGAREVGLAKKTSRSGLQIAVVFTILFCFIFIFCNHALISMFMPENLGDDLPKVVNLASTMMKMAAVYLWGLMLNFVFSAVLRAAGDTRLCLVISFFCDWGMLLATYLAIKVFDFTPLQTWAVYLGFILLNGSLFALRYAGGKWQSLHVV